MSFNVLLARKFHSYFVQLLLKLAFDPKEFCCINFQKPVKLVRLVEWYCSLPQFSAEAGRLLDFSVGKKTNQRTSKSEVSTILWICIC